MTTLLYAAFVVLFVLAILASIGLHELGHLVPAKRFGAKVTQYFIGFGQTVWSRRRGETEYGLKAIPLGGYVKIVGMLPPESGSAEAAAARHGEVAGERRVRGSSTGLFTQLISDARAAEWELVRPGDERRLFYKLPWWKKVVVMAGGPTVNILIAFFLFWAIFATYGQRTEEVDAGPPVVESVSRCVVPYQEEGRACEVSDPPSPAYDAGLRPGDRIVSFNGTPVTGWEQLRDLIQHNADGAAVLVFERDGERRTGRTSTTVQARPTDPTGETVREVGFLGVTPTSHVVVTTGGPLYTLEQMGGMTVDTLHALATLPVKVWDVAQAIAGVEERDPNGPVSVVGGGRLAGEVGAADSLLVEEKVVAVIGLVAGFNLFIGLFNFVPLLPLDGGHIASALWEAVRRGFARLRGRPDPGYVDAAKLLPVAYVVASVLLVMGLVLIVGDLVAPVQVEL